MPVLADRSQAAAHPEVENLLPAEMRPASDLPAHGALIPIPKVVSRGMLVWLLTRKCRCLALQNVQYYWSHAMPDLSACMLELTGEVHRLTVTWLAHPANAPTWEKKQSNVVHSAASAWLCARSSAEASAVAAVVEGGPSSRGAIARA